MLQAVGLQGLIVPAARPLKAVSSAVNRVSLATASSIRRWSAKRPGFVTGIYLNGAWNLAMPLAPIRNIVPPAELTTALNAAFAA